ncbi:DMT family transporter [Albibacillus kandeliae]|uniref:hypothetical protein n=1 Tax=Albibacillus kandeliae TaxID=2174228 RepID=UPI000D69612A|nr:hypothetical protein [Albibacillus kandeliae]
MSPIFSGYFCALSCALAVIVADILLKLSADRGHTFWSPGVMIACGLYVLSALFWFWSMRSMSLAQAGVTYTMFSLVSLFVIGLLFFDEAAAWREFAGIACALCAVLLMVKFT